ncbi:MAG: hypothetical protein KDE58_10830, partial [Caldilineaceae bacterium]|nr:hypothetical protein [Caldilineaceae bacterium]
SGTISATAAVSASIYLPIVSTELTADATAATVQADGEKEAVLVDSGITFYHLWQLDAVDSTGAAVKFEKPMTLTLDIKWLNQLGISHLGVQLYTRETEADPWQQVDMAYNEERQNFVAKLEHFSIYGLGGGLSDSGELLPSTMNFGSDISSGSATVNYPIEAPVGLGGMTPNISLAYSSQSVDDVRRLAGATNHEIQGGIPGYGWSIGGLSYIVEADQFNYMTLNGMRVRISDGGNSSPHIFANVDNNLTTANLQKNLGEWIVIMPDGTKYTFGAAPTQQVWNWNEDLPLETMLSADYIGSQWVTHRKVVKWLLREVVDPQGNRMEYKYKGERGWVAGSCVTGDPQWGDPNTRWYHSATRPQEILWSQKTGTGAISAKMRIAFDYANNRADYQVDSWENLECTQAKYTQYRLTTIRVEVWDGADWHILRKYILNNSYYGTAPDQHMKLDSINQYGKGGATLLNTHSFTYSAFNGEFNSLRLTQANNGWGGVVTYGYRNQETRTCKEQSNGSWSNCENKMRYPVETLIVNDGQSDQHTIKYTYDLRSLERQARDGMEYLGFRIVTVQRFTGNSWLFADEVSSERHWFYQIPNDDQTIVNHTLNTLSAAIATPDPKLGKTRQVWLYQKPEVATASGTCDGRSTDTSGRCLMSETTNTWVAKTPGSSGWSNAVDATYASYPRWVYQEKSVTTQDKTSTTAISRELRYYYEMSRQNGGQFGNLTKVEEYADGGTTRLRATTTEYFPKNTTSLYIVNLPARVQVYGTGGDCHSETRTVYSTVGNQYNTQPTNRLAVKVQTALAACSSVADIESNATTYATEWRETRFTYDSYGNRTSEVMSAGGGSAARTINTTYDSTYKLFPIQISHSPGSMVETMAYYGVNNPTGAHPKPLSDAWAYWGAASEFCAVNGICSRAAYNGFGQLIYRWDAIESATDWNNLTATNATLLRGYQYYGVSGYTTNVITDWVAPRCYGNFTRKVYNGMGQLIQVQSPQQDWAYTYDGCTVTTVNKEVDVSYQYDAFGNQKRAGVPVATTATAKNRAANWTAGYSATTYDALGRPFRVVSPNGGETWTKYSYRSAAVVARKYAGITGDHRVIQWTESDTLGRLYRVRSYTKPFDDGGTVYSTVTLSHDLTDNLLTVANPAGGSTTMTYNLVGQKLSMTDSDLGSWAYSYNRHGLLTEQTDGNGKRTCLYYDQYERLSGKEFVGAGSCSTTPTYDVTYTYDGGHSATNRSKGQLTKVTHTETIPGPNTYQKDLTYNNLGQLIQEAVQISGAGTTFNTYYYYDQYLRLYATKYPDNDIVKLNYN